MVIHHSLARVTFHFYENNNMVYLTLKQVTLQHPITYWFVVFFDPNTRVFRFSVGFFEHRQVWVLFGCWVGWFVLERMGGGWVLVAEGFFVGFVPYFYFPETVCCMPLR